MESCVSHQHTQSYVSVLRQVGKYYLVPFVLSVAEEACTSNKLGGGGEKGVDRNLNTILLYLSTFVAT